MPKLSKVLSVWLAVTGVSLAVFSGCSRESKKASVSAKADEYFKAGEYDKAEIEYKNVLQLDRGDSHAFGRIGRIYFEQGRLILSANVLKTAVELKPDNLEAQIKFGYVNLAFGNRAEARKAALAVLEKSPTDLEAPLLLVEATAEPKDVAEARATLEKLTTAQSAPVLTALGFIYLRERKFSDAEALLERARHADPKFVATQSALGALYLTQKDMVRAEKAIAAAAELSPPRSAPRLQHVQFVLQTGKMDAAKRMLDDMIRATPDFLPSHLLRASIATSEKQFDEALASLQKVLSRDPLNPNALMASAQVHVAKGEHDKAITILEKTVATYAQSAPAHYQLGTVYLAKGDLEKATASLAQAVTLAPKYAPAILTLAQVNVRQRNFVAAVSSLQEFVKQNPKNGDAQLLLAEAYRGQGNLDAAISTYRVLAAANPKNAQLQHLIGTTLLQQNKKVEAREALTKASELSPGFTTPVEQLVTLDLADKQYAAARNRVEKQLSSNPENAAWHLLLAKVHLHEGNGEKGEMYLKKAIELQPDSPTAYSWLAEYYLKANKDEQALPALQSASAKAPKNVDLLLTLGGLHEKRKEYSAAKESYEKAVTIDPNHGSAVNNLANLYSEHFGELDKAQELAQKARALLPSRGETADTLGWVLYRKGQYARALALLEESAEKLPENPEARFHLGMAHYMMGNEDAARVELEKALHLSTSFPGAEDAQQNLAVLSIDATKDASARAAIDQALARRKDDPIALARLAALYQRDGNIGKAVEALETAVNANSSNSTAAASLIRLYRTRKESGKAFELAKATRKLAPGDGRIAHLLGRLAFENREHFSSVGILQEAARRLPDDAEVLFDLGEASYSIGQVSAAERSFQEALAANAQFTRAGKAREYLELITFAQHPTQDPAAKRKIEEALNIDSSNLAALIADAAANEQGGNSNSAIRTYEKALAMFPDFAPAYRNLALLYSSLPDSDGKKALAFASKARETFPNDADVAKAFGLVQFREGNHSRALALLQESARTRTTDAELLYYLGTSQLKLKDQAAGKRSLQRALELKLPEKLAADARKALAAAN
jgi:tetratricopeptide (TPR) repeat protein